MLGKGVCSPTNPCRQLQCWVFLLVMEKTVSPREVDAKKQGAAGCRCGPLLLRWLYFYDVTFEKPVSLVIWCSPTSPPPLACTGFPWYLLVGTAVDLWWLEAAAVARPRCRAAQATLPWKQSLFSSSSHTMEQNSGNEDRTLRMWGGRGRAVSMHCLHSERGTI